MPGWSLPLQRNSHQHCTCEYAARSSHRNIHIRPEVVGWAPRCDLAPLTTSFGTVGRWERQHLAMAATTSPEVVVWAHPV